MKVYNSGDTRALIAALVSSIKDIEIVDEPIAEDIPMCLFNVVEPPSLSWTLPELDKPAQYPKQKVLPKTYRKPVIKQRKIRNY